MQTKSLQAQEVTNIQEGALESPELIFTQGYVRRRTGCHARWVLRPLDRIF